MKTIMIIDAVCIALFVFIFVYVFALPDTAQNLLMPVFTVINPYQTGGWILGIGFLVTCLWGKGRTGLFLGIVLLACYLITAFASLAGLIVATSVFDLLWYLHPILIVIGLIVALCRKTREQSSVEN